MYKLFYNVVYMLTELYIEKRKTTNAGLAQADVITIIIIIIIILYNDQNR